MELAAEPSMWVGEGDTGGCTGVELARKAAQGATANSTLAGEAAETAQRITLVSRWPTDVSALAGIGEASRWLPQP